ncbi:hypothetical protein PBI_SCTP2_65 [Salicola phage SCTP-2]|nr:hypothetical protein PBI_SCTP2_65 [Salicola phage SCTP-2]
MTDYYIQNFKPLVYDVIENNSMEPYAQSTGNSLTSTYMNGILLYRFKHGLQFLNSEIEQFMYIMISKHYQLKSLFEYFIEDINCVNPIFEFNISCKIENRYLPYAIGTIARSAMPPSICGRTMCYYLVLNVHNYNEFKKFKIGNDEYYDLKKFFNYCES